VNKPLVSILIPVFNRDELVGAAIESALNQSYESVEIIIGDNCSTDETWKVIKDYSSRDRRIIAFRNDTNIGPVKNWKKCLDFASGEYVKILFSDDILMTNCIEKMVNALISHSDCAFVFSTVVIGPNIGDVKREYYLGTDNKVVKKEYYDKVIDGLVPFSPGAALFRTVDIKHNLRLDFPTFKNNEYSVHGAGPDVMIYALTSLKYDFVFSISDSLIYFKSHKNSISTENRNNSIFESYVSVWIWFFLFYVNRISALKYLAFSWIRSLRLVKRSFNPLKFASIYYPDISFKDKICLFYFIIIRGLILGFNKFFKYKLFYKTKI
jgi:glycosyltransferase involved in cell wall biosynthesis